MGRDDTPIRRKLTAIVLMTSTLALLFTVASFATYEYFAFRQSAARNLDSLGRIIAANSTAALAFANPDDAREILAALKAEPQIAAAALYDREGKLFATYPESPRPEVLPDSPDRTGYRFAAGYLEGFQPVVQGTSWTVGTLYLRSDLREIYARFRLYGLIAALVFGVSVLMAYLISRRLQRQISQPLLAIANTARAVSDRQDYTVRVPVADGRELGQLTEALNHMLARLQSQEEEQRESQHKLEAQLGRLELLNRITHAIGERQDLSNLFQIVLDRLQDDLPVDFGCVCLCSPSADYVTVARLGARSNALAAELDMMEEAKIATNQNGLARSLKGSLVYEPDVTLVNAPVPRRLARAGLRSLVIAPLVAESTVFGLMLVARHGQHAFSSGECEFLQQLSGHVALASHQSQLYEALQTAYEELRKSQQSALQQERLRALGQLASGIAHDINNAISPVALYTESLLEREPNLSERAREYLGTIQRAVDDVAQTVARMREFYRPREPQLILTQVDVNNIARQVIDLTRARWRDVPQESGIFIELSTDLTSGLPKVMGAESEIRDALTNLIFNAVDAMPQGGVLTLRTYLVSLSAPEGEPETRVTIEVGDTGVGMDEETRARCLEPFYTTKGERGTGLGLAMVFGMVKRHSGEIQIDSKPGIGTAIRLSFAAMTAGSAVAQLPASHLPARRMRVLIIDDDPVLIKSLRDTLEADGHAITTANGGQSGIEAFLSAELRGESFAVVITDLGMPYVDGRKVAAAIRAASSSVTIILLTGWGRRLLDDNDIPPGVNRVLAKPPKLHELRMVFAEIAGRDPMAA